MAALERLDYGNAREMGKVHQVILVRYCHSMYPEPYSPSCELCESLDPIQDHGAQLKGVKQLAGDHHGGTYTGGGTSLMPR
ncbi:unnamed protein product [Bursaphelenchus xylophilus]|uniref:(pine wood nematode) hypothetical protein n=1 Tax=Bursaphelenchus xylophilus TaxID=6326 RepID=A0A1I7SGB9_BURXY|nr:unnamed protein product [Bursaphelenchus xylophilus]CAG9132671.1 unnamed protein product [Bursaphelenchus xylophilus]